jgi:membrane associated rhomboid family serine protease
LDGGELQKAAVLVRDPAAAQDMADAGERKMHSRLLWLFQFLTGLPVEQWNPSLRRPVVVPCIVVLCILTYVYELSAGLGNEVMRLGLVPARFLDLFGGTLLTHMFLHATPWHLLANMYFLWVFGDNVEDRLGRARFLFLYLFSGAAAGLFQVLLTSRPQVPVVGASGAIAGVMAGYALLFPRTRLISLILFWRVRWHASVYLGLWLVMQFVGVAFDMQGIAFWDHVGGFGAGALITLVLRPSGLNLDARQTASLTSETE